MYHALSGIAALAVTAASAAAQASTVPTDVKLPGTQPLEVPGLETPVKCDNCHGGYDAAVEPAHNWRGGMMASAARDPLFWATVAVAERDFPGAGDLCIRCHTPDGWLGGRSTPTDGSGLASSDAFGVSCDVCHQLVDPSGLEHQGVQFPPFVANDGGSPPAAYHGAGEYVLFSGTQKLGPYADAASPHQSSKSAFHRRSALCGTCHDVSNPVVGDLAPGNGALTPLAPGSFSGVPGAPVEGKAAFLNQPYAFGIVERTYSEHAASGLDALRVSEYGTLPQELQAGALKRAHDAAVAAVPSGDYADGTPRVFSCQTCHMRPAQGKGCNKAGAPVRSDLPVHDLTGGSTWMGGVIAHMDGENALAFGGGLSSAELEALPDGALRARQNLKDAASLAVAGESLRVVNLTGHKLPSGYPEGRRMWLRITWLGALGGVLRVDGEYGPIPTVIEGAPAVVESLVDLHDPNTRVWAAHLGMSREWAAALLALGFDPALPIAFDRHTGAVEETLASVAAKAPGTVVESFHFALNDRSISDPRIPPYLFSRDEAALRNVQPVPASLFGDPAPGGAYEHFDVVPLSPPPGAASASIELLYQSTSWEYVQFLELAGGGATPFLGDAGVNLREAWQATGMAPPEVMATAAWEASPIDCNGNGIPDAQEIAAGTSLDCNLNGVPDECDLSSGASLDLDGEGTPDECQPLAADKASISIAAGGTVGLTLTAGSGHAGEVYLVLGSISGTAPGIPVDGLVLPLNYDAYLLLTLSGGGLVQGGFGALDSGGGATAALVAPAGAIPPSFLGVVVHHAYVAIDAGPPLVTLTSNAIPTTLVP